MGFENRQKTGADFVNFWTPVTGRQKKRHRLKAQSAIINNKKNDPQFD